MSKKILVIIFVLNVVCAIGLICTGNYLQSITNVAAAIFSAYVYEDIKND